MLRRTCLALMAAFGLTLPALADPLDDLAAALDLPKLVAVLAEEGQAYGQSLEAEFFPGAGGQRWEALVRDIHDRRRFETALIGRLRVELDDPAQIALMAGYFTTEPGRRIIGLEIAAREAMLDEDVKDAAEAAHADLAEQGDPRLELLDALIEANDLIEQNVAGALNSNLAFYRGMVEGGGAAALADGDMMADLWSQEPQIREETERWLMSYMVLAYGPLGDADLRSYIDFSLRPEGQALNRALFAAFDAAFDGISRDLGLATARFLQGRDI